MVKRDSLDLSRFRMQIDGLHLGEDLMLVAAIRVDGEGNQASVGAGGSGPRMPQRFRPAG